MDDRADSELSFGSVDNGPAWSVVSRGSTSNASTTRHTFGAQKLQDFRNKHLKAMQALRRRVTPPVDASPAHPTGTATSSTHNTLEQPKPLWGLSFTLRAEEKLAQDLNGLHEAVATQQHTLESLQQQDAPSQVAEVRKAIEVQACELDLLRSQETGVLLRGLRESVEICDKMSSQRAQVLHGNIDRLQDTLRSRHRQIEGLRELSAGVGALQRAVDEQGQWQPTAQLLRRELVAVQEILDMQSDALETLAVQLREQHQQDMDSLLSLHEELRVREEQYDTLYAEIEHLRGMGVGCKHN